jgi:ribosomal protein S18 acetylase RimI-like enzyme
LEVLQYNTAAVSVYRRLGFEVSREFNYFRVAASDVRVGRNADGGFGYAERRDWIREVEPAALRETAPEFCGFEPSWQNSFEAIARAPEDFITLGAFDGDRLVGYVIFEPAAGDITQIAVAKTHRRQGIGSALLGEMLRQNRASGVKCINTEISRDEALAGFLQSHGITHVGKQFEMIKKL